jgi:hypothetical protein
MFWTKVSPKTISTERICLSYPIGFRCLWNLDTETTGYKETKGRKRRNSWDAQQNRQWDHKTTEDIFEEFNVDLGEKKWLKHVSKVEDVTYPECPALTSALDGGETLSFTRQAFYPGEMGHRYLG